MKIAVIADQTERAQKAEAVIAQSTKLVSIDQADVIVALGGDGFMLQTLHGIPIKKPFFGINYGSVGFLMNAVEDKKIMDRLKKSSEVKLVPMAVELTTLDNQTIRSFAINDVSLLRASPQAAHLSISVNGVSRMDRLVGDGVLLSTPAGSTAYNSAAHGPILPLESNLWALTPLNSFRPRHWRGALLPQDSEVRVNVLEPKFRPMQVSLDHQCFNNIASVSIKSDPKNAFTLLFDDRNNLHERVIAEQFL